MLLLLHVTITMKLYNCLGVHLRLVRLLHARGEAAAALEEGGGAAVVLAEHAERL